METTLLAHVTIAVRGRLPLARNETERRSLLRALARITHTQLVLFSLVDEHLHTVLRAPFPGRAADSIHRMLRARRPDLTLKSPHVVPVDNKSYLRYLIRYFLEQPQRHDLPTHPALWAGSCFQDLVGARLLPGFSTGPLNEELQRLRKRELFQHVGLQPDPLEPATDGALARVGAARLVELSAAVYCVGPELKGKTRPVNRARVLAASVAFRLGARTSVLAELLGVKVRATRSIAQRKADPRALLCLRRRLVLEELVRHEPSSRPRSA